MYSSWKELYLDKYIEIERTGKVFLLDKNYDPMKDKSTYPIPLDVLHKTWSEIQLDFNSSMSKEAGYVLGLQAKYECYDFQFKILRTAIDLLRHVYDKSALDILKSFQIFINIDYNSELWAKELDRADKVSKSLLVKAIKVEKELKDYEEGKKAKSGSSNDDNGGWEAVLIAMGDHKGILIKSNEITLHQFSIRYNNFTKELERLNTKNGNNK